MTPDEPELSDDELLRYSRQIMLPEIDAAGQVQLKQASVLIVGVGGLGSPAALYLAASRRWSPDAVRSRPRRAVEPATSDRPRHRQHRIAKSRSRHQRAQQP